QSHQLMDRSKLRPPRIARLQEIDQQLRRGGGWNTEDRPTQRERDDARRRYYTAIGVAYDGPVPDQVTGREDGTGAKGAISDQVTRREDGTGAKGAISGIEARERAAKFLGIEGRDREAFENLGKPVERENPYKTDD